MPRRSGVEPLAKVLHYVEEELGDSLSKACAKPDVTAETTGEVERLGDTLYAAARQAKAAAALRRRIRTVDVEGRLRRHLSTPPEAQQQIPKKPEK
jgi:hypothetical protein